MNKVASSKMGDDAPFASDQVVEMLWGKFSYSDSGGGRPVILIHGMGCSRLDWEPVLPYLAGRRLIRVDLCGHGGSSVPREAFSLTDLAYDLLALVDELWLGGVDLVGHSLGGMLSLAMLRLAPERVGKVALVEGWTSLRHSQRLGDAMAGLSPEQARSVASLYRRTFVRWPPLLRDKFWHTVDAFDATGILRSTSRQVLEIYGDRGGERPDQDELGVPRRDNIKMAWIAGGTHYLSMTHANELGRLLRAFLISGNGAAGAGDNDLSAPTLFDLGVLR